MTSFINNKTVDEINFLIQKYKSLLEVSNLKNNEDIPNLAIIYDFSIKYINDKYKLLLKDWKAWSMFIIKKIYFDGKLKHIEDIQQIIDNFINFWKTNYDEYCNNTVAINDYERDMGFVYYYLNHIN